MDYANAVRKPVGSPSTISLSSSSESPKQQTKKPQQQQGGGRQNSPKPQQKSQSGDSSSSSLSGSNGEIAEVREPLVHGSAPQGTKGISPLIRFEISIPEIVKADEDDDEDVEETEEDDAEESTDASTTSGKDKGKGKEGQQQQNEKPKESGNARRYSAQEIVQKKPRQSELVAYLQKHIDDKTFEVKGGFRFFQKAANPKFDNNNGQKPTRLDELNLTTLSQSLRLVQGLTDILKNVQPSSIACGENSYLTLSRAGDLLKITRDYRSSDKKSEFYFKLDEFALQIREQTKNWSKMINSVDLQLTSKGEKGKPDANAFKEKVLKPLHKTEIKKITGDMKSLYSSTAAAPKLSEKFNKQQQLKKERKRNMREETTRMREWALKAVPNVQSFLAMDIHLPETSYRTPQPQPSVDEKAAADSSTQSPQQGNKGGNNKQNQQQQNNNKNNANNNSKQQQQGGGGAKGGNKKAEQQQAEAASSPAAEQRKKERAQAEAKKGLSFTPNAFDAIGEVVAHPEDNESASSPAGGKPQAAPKQPQQQQTQAKKQQQQPQTQQKESPKAATKQQDNKQTDAKKPAAKQQQADSPRPAAEKPKKQDNNQPAAAKKDKSPPTQPAKKDKSEPKKQQDKPSAKSNKDKKGGGGGSAAASKEPAGDNSMVIGGGLALMLVLVAVYLYTQGIIKI